VTYFRLTFYEKTNETWNKKNEYDSLKTFEKPKTKFSNYNHDGLSDYLVSAEIVGSGGNETEYLFIFDSNTRSLRLISGFENLPSTSYNIKTGIITSIGLAASIPNYEYYKIINFQLKKIGGKEIWIDNNYGYLQKYRINNGNKIIYHKEKKKLPFDLYKW